MKRLNKVKMYSLMATIVLMVSGCFVSAPNTAIELAQMGKIKQTKIYDVKYSKASTRVRDYLNECFVNRNADLQIKPYTITEAPINNGVRFAINNARGFLTTIEVKDNNDNTKVNYSAIVASWRIIFKTAEQAIRGNIYQCQSWN